MIENNTFLTLNSTLQENLSKIDIKTPTKVQSVVIPIIAEGSNLIFQSETGTGKTFCYLLPLISKILNNQTENEKKDSSIKLIVCAPTFELASQINQNIKKICSLKSALFIGGAPLKRQIETLKEKPEIIAGTPARLVELIHLKKIKQQNVSAIVFDEADRLVKKELVEETKNLLQQMPENCQKIACSATIDKNTKNFFKDFKTIVMPEEDVLKKNIEHWAMHAESRDKIEVLKKFILAENPEKALIFTSRADQVENIYTKLAYKKIQCVPLHSKSDKRDRKAALDRFRGGKIKFLVTSDLAARGLDIQGITHIIQLDLPSDSDFFIHRAGRTARAGKKGINVVIGDEYELRKLSALEKKLGIVIYPKEIIYGKVCAPQI